MTDSSADPTPDDRGWLRAAAWSIAGVSLLGLAYVGLGLDRGPITCGEYLADDYRGRFDEMYELVDRDHLFYVPDVDERCRADEGDDLRDVLDDMVRQVDEHRADDGI
jgi:hypothetical protein